MTNRELAKALKFLFRLQKLRQDAERIENDIIAHLEAKDASEVQISHYRAFYKDGRLVVDELRPIDNRPRDLIPDYFGSKRR